MQFASDNTSAAHPEVLAALTRANEDYAPAYGADRYTAELTERLRELFQAPDALVYPMTSGTATNAMLLAAMSPPWGVIYCHEDAHIEVDERGAVTLFAGGAKLKPLPSQDGRIDPAQLAQTVTVEAARKDIHAMPPACVSITNITENGVLYTLAQISEIASATRLPLHIDGARLANALAACGASPWEMTREATALSLGGTKFGAFGAEAAVLFDPALQEAFESQRMRGGQNLSKARFVSAQMLALLKDDLWIRLGAHANAMAARLAEGLVERGAELAYPVDGNMIFARLPLARHITAWERGAAYHPMEDIATASAQTPVLARFVASWSTTEAEVDALLAALD
ncbi:threonine aldolase family protein [Celeribacter sp.]|uniref:threonine aldolase family protein n=1 Tax=Celeribacter sp. TaxID=1890673 RepID=UPI003A94901B